MGPPLIANNQFVREGKGGRRASMSVSKAEPGNARGDVVGRRTVTP